jgi:hypothetical protein
MLLLLLLLLLLPPTLRLCVTKQQDKNSVHGSIHDTIKLIRLIEFLLLYFFVSDHVITHHLI